MLTAATLAAVLPMALRLPPPRAHDAPLAAQALAHAVLLAACVASPCQLRRRPDEDVPCVPLAPYFP